jgi:hypothetical protein
MFFRKEDPEFKISCLLGLSSIAAQSYAHWILVLVGDGLRPRHVAQVFAALDASGIPRDKVVFQNMDKRLREQALYGSNRSVWEFAGISALNSALRIAYRLDGVSHIARIDEDDCWSASHLRNLAKAYAAHPTARFAYSQALGYAPEPFPSANSGTRVFSLAPPEPCGLIHATASWSSELPLFYRQEWEQQNSSRSMDSCCGEACVRGTVLPADADLWERIWGMEKRGELLSVFVARPDVLYSDANAKLCALAFLHGTTTSPNCTDAVRDVLQRNAARCTVLE